jgi:hypothetical protein
VAPFVRESVSGEAVASFRRGWKSEFKDLVIKEILANTNQLIMYGTYC